MADIDENNVTWSAGGGVLVFFGTNAGIRFDVRYFRTFGDVNFGPIEVTDKEAVDYARGSIGLVLRF